MESQKKQKVDDKNAFTTKSRKIPPKPSNRRIEERGNATLTN